jgi:catechol 2,3-dioxygenase-like lactoylglutathione lyase family enzyme
MKPTPFAGLRADHLCISVSNFTDTVAWYKTVLGFEDEVYWTVGGHPTLQLAYLTLNGFRLEIVGDHTRPKSNVSPADFAAHFAHQGFTHLCFAVDDIDAVLAELAGRGVEVLFPSQTFALNQFSRRIAFIKDLNGNVIEFAGPLSAN